MGDATGKRADSHLTWARSKSTTAPVEPKKLTEAEAAALETKAGPGAGWNSAQTWEEKDISKWSKELLQDQLLPALTLMLPSEGAAMPPPPASQEALAAAAADGTLQCQLKVTAVDKLDGEASHIVSRGKQRVVFEFTLKLKLEVEVRVAGELHEILAGTVSMSDVTNDELQAAKMPSAKCTCEQAGYLPFFEPVVKSFWPTLRTGLSDYVEQVRQALRRLDLPVLPVSSDARELLPSQLPRSSDRSRVRVPPRLVHRASKNGETEASASIL